MKPLEIKGVSTDRVDLVAKGLGELHIERAKPIARALDLFYNKNSAFGLLDLYINGFPLGMSLAAISCYRLYGKDIDVAINTLRSRTRTSCEVIKTINFDNLNEVVEYLGYPKLEFDIFNPATLLDWKAEPGYFPLQQAIKQKNIPDLIYHLVGLKTGFNIKHWPLKYKEMTVLLNAAYAKVVLCHNPLLYATG